MRSYYHIFIEDKMATTYVIRMEEINPDQFLCRLPVCDVLGTGQAMTLLPTHLLTAAPHPIMVELVAFLIEVYFQVYLDLVKKINQSQISNK